jgi:hypothetical protein
MKLPLLAALAALSLYGCSSQSSNTREASAPEAGAVGGSGMDSSIDSSEAAAVESMTPGEASNVTNLEERDRLDAPTVYEGEATGGSGSGSETVKTDDGQTWDVQQNNGLDLGDTRSKSADAVNQNDDATGGSGKSEVIEEPASQDNTTINTKNKDTNKINKSDVSLPTTKSTNK